MLRNLILQLFATLLLLTHTVLSAPQSQAATSFEEILATDSMNGPSSTMVFIPMSTITGSVSAVDSASSPASATFADTTETVATGKSSASGASATSGSSVAFGLGTSTTGTAGASGTTSHAPGVPSTMGSGTAGRVGVGMRGVMAVAAGLVFAI